MSTMGHKTRRPLTQLLLAVALLATVSGMAAAPVGAQSAGCADVPVVPGVILYSGHQTHGPVPVSVPAGTYRVMATSLDVPHVPGYQPEQRQESWRFSTDTGYQSAATPDLAEGLTTQTFDLGEVTFSSDVSSITFHWAGVLAQIDSVRPEQLLLECQSLVASATTTTTSAPATTTTTTTVPPTTTAVTTTTAPTTTSQPVESTSTTGEVLGTSTTVVASEIEDPGSTLPQTGGSTGIAWFGVVFVAVGGVFAFTGRLSKELVQGG
jgi:LPXTG-motif cell wall-anchored protein